MKKLFICSLLFLSACNKASPPPVQKPVEVRIYVVDPQTIPVDFELMGVVQSSHSVEIRPRVAGYLEKIAYKEGAFVKAGDPLFQIEAKQFEDAVREAQANLEKEEAALWLAEQTVNRFKPLFEQKAASKKDVDDATAQQLSEQALVNVFKAKLDEASINLGYATITSPIAGFTTNARFQEGSVVSFESKEPLTTVFAIDPIWVVINVSEDFFLISNREVAKGELIIPENYDFEVTLTLSDGSIFPEKGKVSFLAPIFNESTGTLSSRAVFPNPKYILKPGQFVKAKGVGAKRPNAIIIPQQAVQQGAKGQFVYVVNSNDKVEMRMVEVGDWYRQYWIIKSGLKKGDRVVVDGLNKIQDQTLVKVKHD
jgi:membrane fusion protein (multidrug efflux system)